MAILRRYENGIAWVSADEADLNCIIFHYPESPTQAQIDTDYAAFINATQYDQFPVVPFNIEPYRELIIDFVRYIKTHPTINLTQYNNLLATLQWWEAYVIKFFVFKLAVGLSELYQVNISEYTETQMLLNVRNWIVANPPRKIARVVFGQTFGF